MGEVGAWLLDDAEESKRILEMCRGFQTSMDEGSPDTDKLKKLSSDYCRLIGDRNSILSHSFSTEYFHRINRGLFWLCQ